MLTPTMDAWIGVVGAVLGVGVGGAISFLTQRQSYSREANERLAGLRREAYLSYLAAVHEMFDSISDLHRRARGGDIDELTARAQLRAVPAAKAQNALESLRLVATDSVASAAARLWERMRRDPSPVGRDVGWRAFTDWRHTYWKARRDLVDVARQDTGLAALDWSTAGLP